MKYNNRCIPTHSPFEVTSTKINCHTFTSLFAYKLANIKLKAQDADLLHNFSSWKTLSVEACVTVWEFECGFRKAWIQSYLHLAA